MSAGTSAWAGLPRVCVIGAGVSGLVSMMRLADYAVPFECFDAGDRGGGNRAFGNSNGHSGAYRSLRRVLVVGNSAADVVCELSQGSYGARVLLSTRSGTYVVPKYLVGRPVFVGFGQALPTLFPFVECQDRLLARYAVGRYRPPEPVVMETVIAADEKRYCGYCSPRPCHTQRLDYFVDERDIRARELPAGQARAAKQGPVCLAGRASTPVAGGRR